MIGQNAVLDRTEQRADHAEQEQRKEEHRHRMGDEADDRYQGNAELRELEPLRHYGFVVPVGEFAAETGEEEIRRDEHSRRESDQRLRRAAADLEQDQKDQ